MSGLALTRRTLVLGAIPAACGLASTGDGAAPEPLVDVRSFGASPAASALENTRAFAAASATINRAGGGTLLIPPGEYRVGHQQNRRPLDIIRIEGCRRPVLISGKGAVLKAADGIKFGSFHPITGRRFDPPKLPFLDHAYRIDAYEMIFVKNCRGSVRIEDVELDGNLGAYDLGGEWDLTGRQVEADGIRLENNTGGTTVARVNSHHHGRDGIIIMHYGLKPSEPRYPIILVDVTCDSNARQGLSWTGGNDFTALRCRFTRTGRVRFASGPTAGVDVEAELSICRNGRFIECTFADNGGVGFVAEAGDVADIELERCTFIGTTQWSAWPNKPGIVFRDCQFIGPIIRAHASEDPRKATQFLSCRFRGDTRLSPTGKLFGDVVANLGAGSTNVLMSNCSFEALSPQFALPWSLPDARYRDCRFRQTGSLVSHPRGTFSGVNTIQSAGPVNLAGSRFLDPVTLNGQLVS